MILLTQKLKTVSAATGEEGAEGEEEGGEGEEVERGIVLDLGDFILNLSDSSARRYLKVSVALELSKKDTDPDPTKAAEGGHGGGHGGEGADRWQQSIRKCLNINGD
jgi:hypothetical protein